SLRTLGAAPGGGRRPRRLDDGPVSPQPARPSRDRRRPVAGGSERVEQGEGRALMEPAPAEATAYHEAGLAVLVSALGAPVGCVSVVPSRHFLGACEFGKAVFRPTEDWLEREMLIALAGLAAETRYGGDDAWDGAVRDRDYAGDLALQRAGNARKAQRLLRRMLSKAEHLLAQEENWRAVERMAAELLRVGEISGRAARHIYEQSCRESR